MKLTNDGHQPTRESTPGKTTNQASGITSELLVTQEESQVELAENLYGKPTSSKWFQAIPMASQTTFMNVGTEEGSHGLSVLADLDGLLPEDALWHAERSTSPFQRTSLGGRRAARK
jgi:hypothetical protein